VTPGLALLVALGSAVGSPTRYLVDRALQSAHGTVFPWGTFTVNVVAALGLGVLLGGPAPSAVVAALGTGFCAGLSTWSTLAYETVRLAEDRARTSAVLNVVMSTFAGLGAAGVGLALGAALWS
jgi:fluoride exporter